MIGCSSSSSLIMRWASGMLRDRFAMAITSSSTAPLFLFSPTFNGVLSGQFRQQLQLSPCGGDVSLLPDTESQQEEHIWFAVPKSKISRSRKRMKTTRQKRIPLKKNIVFDPRTGEVTLKHKMPYNWKDYLPKMD